MGLGTGHAGVQQIGPDVVFVSPSGPANSFWHPATEFMQQAANNLGVSLQVIYTEEDHTKMIDEVRNLCLRAKKPDYLVLVNHRDATPFAIREADNCGIQTVLYNGAFAPETRADLHAGPQALNHWVGSILPDEHQSGYLVAKALLERARDLNLYASDGKIHIAGLNGALRSFTSMQRAAGLQQYVAESDDLVLTQVVPAFWKYEKSRELSSRLLKRFPKIKVLWAASDSMAVGAMEAIQLSGREPGKDALAAGVDWIPVTFEHIESGAVLGSVGGHLFDGAWVMVMVFDHFHGHVENFFDIKTQFAFAGKEDLASLKALIDREAWSRLDFKRYSQHYGAQGNYAFGAELVLKQIRDTM